MNETFKVKFKNGKVTAYGDPTSLEHICMPSRNSKITKSNLSCTNALNQNQKSGKADS